MDAPQSAYVAHIYHRAEHPASVAVLKFPVPNCTITKVAEEAGEVVRDAVYLSEGRDATWEGLEAEVIQMIAMGLRLLIEGDGVHGLNPPEGRGFVPLITKL